MKSSYDPHSVYGYDPDTGLARERPEWMQGTPGEDTETTAARVAAVAERYRILDEQRQAVRS